MTKLTHDDVKEMLGSSVDDLAIARIIGTGATAEELHEAFAWFTNNEAMMNAGRPLPTGRAAQLVEILNATAALEEEDPARP